MEYSLCKSNKNLKCAFYGSSGSNVIDDSGQLDEGSYLSLENSCKKQKIENWDHSQSSETVDKLIDDWISEYKAWYEITYGKDGCLNDECNDAVDANQLYQSECANGNTQLHARITKPPPLPPQINYGPMKNLTADVSYFPLRHTMKNKQQRPPNVGYWGPLLRYGTYGVYKRYNKPVALKINYQTTKDALDNSDNMKLVLIYPLDLPLRIKIPRQAMICTLQFKLKSRLHDLKYIEKDSVLHMGINYSNNLELVTKQCGTCPKYLYTKVDSLPSAEREYFTFLERNSDDRRYLSVDGSTYNEMKSTNDFFICELLIGDIIISQGFALWKRRAREVCAKKAFISLDSPSYLVGSTRYWYGTDYMTACTTNDPSVAPILPPFVTDPTEPLYKKDEKINESDPEENFDILNPKSIHDFWLYATTLKPGGNIKNIDPQTLLYQSAEFSQMNLSFEIDSSWDQSFACTIMIDKSPAIKVEGLGNLEQACQAAALVLVDKLVDTQPIVVLQEIYHQNYVDLERQESQSRNNAFLVRSLMWAQQDFDAPIDFRDLSQLIARETFSSTATKLQPLSSTDIITSERDLEYFLDIYAQSSLVNPLRIDVTHVTPGLWPCVVEKSREIGLIVMHESSNESHEPSSVLICKQVPHTKLKAMLMRDKCFGVFSLLSDGTLPTTYIESLNQFIYYNDGDNDDTSVSNGCGGEDPCDRFYLNTESMFDPAHPSMYSDIINDIPRDLIPGLDF